MSKDRMTLTRKIKLIPVGDKEEVNRVYTYIREGQYAQYQACNLFMGQLASEYYKCNRNIKDPEFIQRQREITLKENSLFSDIKFPTGADTRSQSMRKVQQDFSTALKNGLARGERTITNYKRTNSLLTLGRNLKFYHNYNSYTEFLDNIKSPDLSVYIKWINKITFKIIFGNPHRSEELRSVIKNILEENYKVQGSSIAVEGKEIILNLTLSIPKQIRELDEQTVVGVNLGLTVPAMCALNNNPYERLSIGSADDFLRIRTQMQAQRKRLQASLQTTTGGHGRKKKLQALNRLRDREKNFAETYCHMISHKVVNFALKNNAKYINIENIAGYDTNKFILRNWNYYKMQQYISYKAEKYGIIVRKINPCYVSQVCSVCGNWGETQKKSSTLFICSNKDCTSHKDKYGFDANFNAARNVAMSTAWSEDPLTAKDFEEARIRYGIPEDADNKNNNKTEE